jgi:Bacterial extracellular solute-binding protein/von Willebrand factor type A domain
MGTKSPARSSSRAGAGVRNLVLAVTLAMLAGIGYLGWQVAAGDEVAAAGTTTCDADPITVTVAPLLEDLMQEAADHLATKANCINLEVTDATVAEVQDGLEELEEADRAAALPDLWVPNSPVWRTVLQRVGYTGRVEAPALASSPVGLASGRDDAPASWLETLTSDRLVMSDPAIDGASAFALTAPLNEGTPLGEVQSKVVPMAQTFGERVTSGIEVVTNADVLEAGESWLVPITERDFVIARRGNEALRWSAPSDGSPMLTYPLVAARAQTGMTMGTGSLDPVRAAGDAVADFFATDAVQEELTDLYLRGPEGDPLPDEMEAPQIEVLDEATTSEADAVLRNFSVLTVPSSLLAIVDASESMNRTAADGQTRMDFAVNAALTALDAFPGHARIGLWGFSTDQDGPGKDWVELAPLRRLDAPAEDGGKHLRLLRRQALVLPTLIKGGTGLYDTVLAGYSQAVRDFNENYYNTLVILTDGANDDPSSISLQQLLRELKTMHDPASPVRIVAVGISEEADMVALGKMAEVTSGGAFLAEQPQDILTVLATSLLTRG